MKTSYLLPHSLLPLPLRCWRSIPTQLIPVPILVRDQSLRLVHAEGRFDKVSGSSRLIVRPRPVAWT
jgi:hypothetical protein